MSQRICAARMINEIMYRDCRYANCQLCTNLIPCNGAVLVVVVVLSSSFWRTRWEWNTSLFVLLVSSWIYIYEFEKNF